MDITKLLKKCRTTQAYSTHVGMGEKHRGKYIFNRDDLENLWSLLPKPICLAERHQKYTQLVIDVDLSAERSELYTTDDVEKLIQIIHTVVKTEVYDVDEKELLCVYLSKPPYKKSETIWKNGFHLQFPYLFLNQDDMKTIIFPSIISKVKESTLFPLFEKKDKIIDCASISNPWLMYGCVKEEGKDPYLVDTIYDFKLNKCDQSVFSDYKLYDTNEKEIPMTDISRFGTTSLFPRILSVVPYNRKIKEIKKAKIVFVDDKERAFEVKDKDDDEIHKTDLSTLRSLLYMISPSRADDYTDWRRIGWILHYETNGSDEGLELWKEFSESSDKYDEANCDFDWARIVDKVDGVKIGTLKYYAKLDSPDKYKEWLRSCNKSFEIEREIPWNLYTSKLNEEYNEWETHKKDDIYYSAVNEVLKDMNNYLIAVTGTSKPYFLIRNVKKDALGNDYITYVRQLKGSLKDTYQPFGFKMIGKKPKTVKFIDKWLEWVGRKSVLEETFVSKDKETPNTFNTFVKFSISKEMAQARGNKDISGLLNFILVAWANNNHEIYDWILNWFAHIIQKPLDKMNTCIVLQGEEGIGKGMVVQKFIDILGRHYTCQPSTPDDILGNFNSIIDKKAFLFFDEIVWGGNKEKSGVLKKIITEKNGTINEKGIPQRPFVNVANVIMSSNEDWVIPAGNNARRFMVLNVQNTELDKSKVYDACPYSFAKFLYERDISSFQSDKIITTTALMHQKELTTDYIGKFLLDIARHVINVGHKDEETVLKVEKTVLLTHYKNYHSDKYNTPSTFFKKLKSMIGNIVESKMGSELRVILIHFPSITTLKERLNIYFKQDMFIEDNETLEIEDE